MLEETEDLLVPSTPVTWNLWESLDTDSDKDNYSENEKNKSDDGTESDSFFESKYFLSQSTQHTKVDAQEILLQTVMAAEVPATVQPLAVTFIGSKVKIQRNFNQAVEFINQHADFFLAKKTSVKHIKYVLLNGNGTISTSKYKSLWTVNIAVVKKNHLQYEVEFDKQFQQNRNFNQEYSFPPWPIMSTQTTSSNAANWNQICVKECFF
ncbi:hypothetical protein BC830DRAFT_622940 [Chytriomyces sp. MP71]|nr:hypothetical protein BC830DRAFT_622940 [Chytriomyces sp. MP71]